jgi:hypothetical protein
VHPCDGHPLVLLAAAAGGAEPSPPPAWSSSARRPSWWCRPWSRLRAEAAAAERRRAAARAASPWPGPARPQRLGPLSAEPPVWLGGSLPGDYGALMPLARHVELELMYALWVMLGVLGALAIECSGPNYHTTTDTLPAAGLALFREPVWGACVVAHARAPRTTRALERWGAATLVGEGLDCLGVAGLRVAGAGQGHTRTRAHSPSRGARGRPCSGSTCWNRNYWIGKAARAPTLFVGGW